MSNGAPVVHCWSRWAIVKLQKDFKRPTVAPTFGVQEQSQARFLVPIIIGARIAPICSNATLMRSDAFNHAENIGAFDFLVDTPDISG